MNKESEEVGRRLKTMRIERGLSGGEVASRSNVHPTTLSRIEGGTEDPKFSTAKRIVEQGLGASLSELS